MAANIIPSAVTSGLNSSGPSSQPDKWWRPTKVSKTKPKSAASHIKQEKRSKLQIPICRASSVVSKKSSETQSSIDSLSACKLSSTAKYSNRRGRLSRLKGLAKTFNVGHRQVSIPYSSSDSPATSSVDLKNSEYRRADEPALETLKAALFSKRQQRLRGPKKLFELPTEILLIITNMLPTSSAAALSLCCHALLRKLGSGSILRINRARSIPYTEWFKSYRDGPKPGPEEIERQTFLEFLDRDSSELIYCYYCKKLHTPELTNSWRTGPRIYISDRRPCAMVQAYQRPDRYMDEYLNFSQVQHLMKHHRAGRDTSLLLKAMERTYTVYEHQYAHQRSTHFQISPSGHFLARTQHWVAIKRKPEQIPVLPDSCMIELCPHFSSYSSKAFLIEINFQIRFMKLYMASEPSNRPPLSWTRVRSCRCCNTEYGLGSKQITDDTWALCFTVWQDFGECRNPFEQDWEDLTLGSSACKKPDILYRKSNIRKHFGESRFDEGGDQ
ncbi:hypothetical protein BKA64DRAFT_440021 [Cadophora sp. MPI-SDFR-AT-0126]|nr:hypothetical protein BKA64DRAFT_440021 [Leotiomycetes sp. MPI-SDFR-AT-0126]